ncbi:ABC transporter permease [Flavihumibacter sp. ZG627]|uniref:ABC transporter permease n=1 Tax=Flavihumibacter sp. ZG627 TaxID=1463156 RepID=UPI0005809C9C|nr:ABC transporter permease [Flavihumibacter sp. ZG627]KIC90120.1 cell division protein FtsX [Flavihumibacter sp. ZG627]
MLFNNLKIAWRTLIKNKFFSLLNIIGLATGLACFLLIALYVIDELSYDRYHEKADRIYRVNSDILFGGNSMALAVSSDMMGQTLKKDYPEVEQFTRIYASNGSRLIKKGSDYLEEMLVCHVDSTFFEVFSFQPVAGDLKNALDEPNTVVISETAAKKYFNNLDVVGKTLDVNDNGGTLYKITAVIKDMPKQSHFRYDFLFSMDNLQYGFGDHLSHNFATYLLLRPGVTAKSLEAKFPDYMNRHIFPILQQVMQVKNLDDMKKSGNSLTYSLMPIKDIHLHSGRRAELSINSDIQYVYIFMAVAIFILLIACINFMNLSTARSANRAKEVGIRKVLGTTYQTLIRQFLTESTLLSFFSLVIAIAIAVFALPLFNSIAGKQISASQFFQPLFVVVLISIPFVIGLLAGIYPAFYLSSFKPITVLKGKLSGGSKKSNLRSVLVILQFSMAILLIVGTIVVYRQLGYIQQKKLGFVKDQVVVIHNTQVLGEGTKAFKNELLSIPGVKMVTDGGYLPVDNSSRNDNTFSKEAVMDMKNGFNMQVWNIDENYIPVLGMELKQGRNFSREFQSDSMALLINETTAQMLGYEDPIGKKIYKSNSNVGSELLAFTIIGVVKNFHFESLKQQIGPLCMRLGRADYTIAMKVDAARIPTMVKEIEKKFDAQAAGFPFQYSFLDASFNEMYKAEEKAGKLAFSFAVLAILIACLGLFGLAAFMAEQRTKEIGVRKVLGASVNQIMVLLSKDFLKLVAISACLAFPISWLVMNKWLQDFAFRIDIGWWVFIVAGLMAALIALFTVGFQALRAALNNPTQSLRSE